MEDIPFSDWPGGQPADFSSGSNPWLPAYGFQTPSALLEKEDFLNSPDSEYFLHNNVDHYVYLETIQEETLDDLRSENDLSELMSPIGWLATDSESGSVICNDSDEANCESDRELACPSKRRRQDNFLTIPSSDDDSQSLSRSSSLLQFETLEKQCQETYCSSPSIFSNFSYDSIESNQHNNKDDVSLNSLEDNIKLNCQKCNQDAGVLENNSNYCCTSDSGTDTEDSESTLEASRSFDNLKSWHSFDSLPCLSSTNTSHNNNNSKSGKEVMSAENLSEDSGYSDYSCFNNNKNKSQVSQKNDKPTENINRLITSTKNGLNPESFGMNGNLPNVKKRSVDFTAYDFKGFQNFYGNFSISYQNLCIVDKNEFEFDKFLTKLKSNENESVSCVINLENSSSECEQQSKYKCTSTSEPNLPQIISDFLDRPTNSSYSITKDLDNCVCACSVPKNLDLIANNKCSSDIWNNTNSWKTSIAVKNWDLADLARNDSSSNLNKSDSLNAKDLLNANTIDEEEMPHFKRESSYSEAMSNRVDLSDDEHSLCYKPKLPKSPIIEFDKKVLSCISETSLSSKLSDEVFVSSLYLPLSAASAKDVASTPNLAITSKNEETTDDDFPTKRRRSTQEIYLKSSLTNRSTSTSGVSDAEDKTLSMMKSLCDSSKGVHFSPVVSEVNWHDDSASTATIERESSYSLSDSPTPERDLPPKHRRTKYSNLPRDRLTTSQPDLHNNTKHEFVSSLKSLRNDYSKSQPDMSKLKRRGSQMIAKDRDGCIIKAYVDGDGIQYKHTHLDMNDVYGPGKSPTQPNSHVTDTNSTKSKVKSVGNMIESNPQQEQSNHKTRSGKLGNFFSRLTSFRFSARKSSDRKSRGKKKNEGGKGPAIAVQQRVATKEDYIYIPLKGPPASTANEPSTVNGPTNRNGLNNNSRQKLVDAPTINKKPPLPKLPPRVIGASVKRESNAHDNNSIEQEQQRRRRRTIDSGESCPRPMEPMGLIETNLDTDETIIRSGPNVKTRSLLNLGGTPQLDLLSAAQNTTEGGTHSSNRPHKSMEFLLDKQNIRVVEPPENELQKGERVMSEHQLRVQRSLQKLTVPDWYKHSQVPREGFLLKKNTNRETRWTGTSSKTTSLSSLGSNNLSPIILSPTTTNQPFVRWSTSKLNSTASSPCASVRSSFSTTRQHNGSISPSSVRSSFNYKQPYMGWRSQERLIKPKTPAERLASTILNNNNNNNSNEICKDLEESSEIQSSIKEVTSAIVHYVSGLRPDDQETCPRSRSVSPRGSQKLCWLESSFVGTKPLDSPQTPISLSENQASVSTPPTTLHLNLQSHDDLTLLHTGPKPSPGSTTLEDVLDSLLGLPSTDRASSPSLQATASANTSPNRLENQTGAVEHFRRRSEGNESNTLHYSNTRKINLHSSPILRCRFSRCGRTAIASTPEAAAFKFCHNCTYTYCSRACRRAHWEKHRKTCLFSRIGTLCRQVIAAAKEQNDTLLHLSLIARRGYLSHGLGAVKCFFTCPEAAEKFLSNGLNSLGELTYVCWPDLLPSEMGPQLYAELVKMCKNYNPDSKLVLYVSICVVSEIPTSGAMKWERQLVSRCAKMRLSKDLSIPEKETDNPETLILTCTSIQGTTKDETKELKETSVNNVYKELKQRGVSLRNQHPSIFKQLCAYADGTCEKFTPVTVYSKDAATGKNFMCIIMLEADQSSLNQVKTAGVKVRTVDVLCE